MKALRACLLIALLLLLSITFNPGLPHAVAGEGPYEIYLPIIPHLSTSPPENILIVDHTSTDIIKIPDEWIEQAKSLTFHYAHTSHGSQIISGLHWLELQDSKYNFAVYESGVAPALPGDPTALRIYDGNPPETYIEPDDYWESLEGVNRTRAVAATGLFDYSMWSWCGQMSWYSPSQVQLYIDTLHGLEGEYPAMRFIYMTGHTDGSVANTAPIHANNGAVREYANASQAVLFDFADIESYDPAGTFYPDATDSCTWCPAYCAQNPAECANLDQMGSCAHSHPLICKLKGQAFWWLAARLAGWPGPNQ